MKKQKSAKPDASAKAKLPAGTPKASTHKDKVYTATETSDPPVPNRAHTEM